MILFLALFFISSGGFAYEKFDTPTSGCIFKSRALANCSSEYESCHFGVLSKSNCEPSYAYDAKDGNCKEKTKIILCPEYINQYPEYSDPEINRMFLSYTEEMRDYERGVWGCDFNARALGNCSEVYLFCYDYVVYDIICPDGLAYDEHGRRCEEKSLIRSCPEYVQPTVNMSNAEILLLSTNFTGRELTYGCHFNSRALGKCSSMFEFCFNGTIHNVTCNNEFAYHESHKVCKEKTSMDDCPPNPYYTDWDKSQVELQALVKELKEKEPSRGCTFTIKEYQYRKCTDYYEICYYGNIYPVDCPYSLVFDVETEMCNFRRRTPACGDVGNSWEMTDVSHSMKKPCGDMKVVIEFLDYDDRAIIWDSNAQMCLKEVQLDDLESYKESHKRYLRSGLIATNDGRFTLALPSEQLKILFNERIDLIDKVTTFRNSNTNTTKSPMKEIGVSYIDPPTICYDNWKCNKGFQCDSLHTTGTCNCKLSQLRNGNSCESDLECGNLKNSCNPITRTCDFRGAWSLLGVKNVDDHISKFCSKKECGSDEDCHGLLCEFAFCYPSAEQRRPKSMRNLSYHSNSFSLFG